MNSLQQGNEDGKQAADVIGGGVRKAQPMPTGDSCFVKVAIGDVVYDRLLQTRWMEVRTHNGPGAPSLETGSWYRSHEKYGAEFGRFLNLHANESFRMALIKELGG